MEHLNIDPEDLAAFADGRLRGEARRAMVERLAEDRAARELLADVMAIRDEVDGEEAGEDAEESEGEEANRHDPAGEVGTVIRGPWTRRAWAGVAALAAALALFVVAPRLLGPVDPPGVESLAGELTVADLDILEEPIWSAMRSGGSGDGLRDDLAARGSFRWGVRAVDFQVAVGAADAERVERAAHAADRVLAGTPLAAQYPSLASEEPATALEAGADLAELGAEGILADSFFFRYGMWVRAAWLAAVSGDADFFASAAGRSLDALEVPADLPEDAGSPAELEAEIDTLRSLAAAVASGEGEMERLESALWSVLEERSRR